MDNGLAAVNRVVWDVANFTQFARKPFREAAPPNGDAQFCVRTMIQAIGVNNAENVGKYDMNFCAGRVCAGDY